MAKVIVERPRHGSRLPSKRKGYNRSSARIAWDEKPRRERMKLRGGGGKLLNEHLAPLRRYLATQVGKPWNKIFADVCRFLDRNSAVQDHVRDHLEDYVAIHVVEVGDELRYAAGYGIGRPLVSLFYVCPRSGLLKKTPKYSRPYFEPREKLTPRWLGHATALVRMNGVWLVITTEPFQERKWVAGRMYDQAIPLYRWDALLKVNLYRGQAIRVYGVPICAVEVRQAGKREVRQVLSSYPRTNVVH